MKFKFLVLAMLVFGISFSSAAFSNSNSNWQAYQPTFDELYSSSELSTYWSILENADSEQCSSVTSDFVIGIPPGGCSPSVVTSELLEDQNVPVFCQLYAIKVNPLIKVSSIKSISFKGGYPDGVSSVSFHPARAAVNSYTSLVGDSSVENIGYVVIVLKREKVEDNMEDWVAGNLTATIKYDADDAFGVGKAEFYLPVLSDEQWEEDYPSYSFWSGLGYLRATSVDGDSASIQVLKSSQDSVSTVRLSEGDTSNTIYMPGYYCKAGLTLKLEGLVTSEDTVLLNVDGEEIWAREGGKILDDKCKVSSIRIVDSDNKVSTDKEDSQSAEVSIVCSGSSKLTLSMSKKSESSVLEDFEAVGSALEGFESNFKLSKEIVEELVDIYPSELKGNTEDTYGEEALLDEIELAREVGKLETRNELMELFLDTYPTSRAADDLRHELELSGDYDYTDAYGSVYLSGELKTVSLVDYSVKDATESSADFDIAGKSYSGEKENFSKSIEGGTVSIVEILPGKVKFKYTYTESKKTKTVTETVNEGEYGTLNDIEVYVRNVNVLALAKVSLTPKVSNTKSESNFTFRIGIEKRAIDLSPERTQKMIASLNKTIEKWQNINERLSTLITAWKGACFATTGILVLKNMIGGVTGESLARQKVMQKYKSICDTQYPDMSRTECYNQLSKEIDSDVKTMTLAINNVNDKMDSQIDKFKTSGGILEDGVITDQEGYKESLRDQLGSFSYTTEVNGQEVTLNADDLQTTSQIQSALLYQELQGKGGATESQAEAELETSVRNIASIAQAKQTAKSSVQDIDVDVEDVVIMSSQKTVYYDWTGKTAKDYSYSGTYSDSPAQLVTKNAKTYLLILQQASGNKLYATHVFERSSGVWNDVTDASLKNFNDVVFYGSSSDSDCSNRWPSGKAAVSYYESGTDKGLPAIVPFDLEDGWYAMVPNSGGTFTDSDVSGYTASGDASYFKICNIGSNQVMESGSGDDLCQSFSSNTVGSVDTFIPCRTMGSSEVSKLYSEAKNAIKQASQQYDACIGAGTDTTIKVGDELISCGEPMSSVGGYECQDFMSPSDCKLMFNVCDPVICPASRCDLGGKMPVSDVIQTGIVGGIFLCWPNYKEGILIPVCVSGINAGIESFVSILESERDCLQESLDSGEHVGICDEITSIYMCEFFWKQLSPMMDYLIPSAIDFLSTGGQTKGGGEYLLVQSAWENMQSSVDYFQETYAVNAFRAFSLKNTEEAGGDICKSFIGSSFPTSADAFEELLEPESPSQFYAHFSETTFTEATVPATSQYKVYYHIYSGKDSGVQYKVYLKNPPATSYYASNPTVTVKSGFIAAGDSADESIDFTAPAGYKELCVVINAEEECGFESVTTDLGIDYLTSAYVEDQAEETDITTEKECISGTTTALSLLSLNLQEGVEDLIDPEIALDGIVRVCATGNPGEGVDSLGYVTCDEKDDCDSSYDCSDDGYCETNGIKQVGYGRWKDVGYCGDTNMRCWLDTESVVDALETVASLEDSSISLLEERQGLIESGSLSSEQVQAVLSSSSKSIKELTEKDVKSYLNDSDSGDIYDIVTDLDLVIGTDDTIGSGTNANRAYALAMKASIYRFIVSVIYEANPSLVKIPEVQRIMEGESCDEDDEDFCGDDLVCYEGECMTESNAINLQTVTYGLDCTDDDVCGELVCYIPPYSESGTCIAEEEKEENEIEDSYYGMSCTDECPGNLVCYLFEGEESMICTTQEEIDEDIAADLNANDEDAFSSANNLWSISNDGDREYISYGGEASQYFIEKTSTEGSYLVEDSENSNLIVGRYTSNGGFTINDNEFEVPLKELVGLKYSEEQGIYSEN